MKGRAITVAKRELNPLCEDASRIETGQLLAVSDGAGGGGLYADQWAKYLLEHLPIRTFTTAEELDAWLSEIWEPFYLDCERQAEAQGSWHLNKFYDEGAFATLVALWREDKSRYQWVAYGDSVAFHYSRRKKKLSHSFTSLADFAQAPYLINCKDELRAEGFRSGVFEVERGDYVFVASDALAYHILMMYALTHPSIYREDLAGALAQPSRQADLLRQASLNHPRHFYPEVLRPLLRAATTQIHFARYLDKLLRQGWLGTDDYSLVWHKVC